MDARELLTPAGAELLAAVCADARNDLAVATAYRSSYEPPLVSLALQQRELRRRAASRIESAGTMLFTRAGLEQASATVVARHRAERFQGLSRVIDVCCGIGGDARELAAVVPTVIGVDLDPVHLRLARHNAGIHPVRAVAEQLPLRSDDAIFIDPARRTATSRRRGHDEMSPTLAHCIELAAARRLAIKCAPGLDLDQVPDGWSVEAVATGRDLKELVLWSPAWGPPSRQATVIRGAVIHAFSGVTDVRAEVTGIRTHLYDPSPTITRTGQVTSLAADLGATMIDPQIAFLTADRASASPFVRSLRVLESMPWSLKPVKAMLAALGIGIVEIRQRGLTVGDVEGVRRRLAGKGSSAVLVLTRLGDKPWAIICKDDAGESALASSPQRGDSR